MDQKQLLESLHGYFPFGFALSGEVWKKYELSTLLPLSAEKQIWSDLTAVRRFTDLLNQEVETKKLLALPVYAGQLISVGIIVDTLRYLLGLYCHLHFKGVFTRGLAQVRQEQDSTVVEQPPPAFVELFPPLSVGQKRQLPPEYLAATSPPGPNREVVTGELVLLSIAQSNPAFGFLRGLFDDSQLARQTPYRALIKSLEGFFFAQPAFPPLGLPLFACLRAPIEASPDSLTDQIGYMRKHWASFLPPDLMEKMLLAEDILKEEERQRGGGGDGPGPNLVLDFVRREYRGEDDYAEPARFSRDADWMSNVVIIAKTVYVWLDQLSKKYQRQIKHLSEIPDEELDRLARWGFTGLWLIGVWQRSNASERIKKAMGNPEAAASAYSLYDYVIADDLGGETALTNLRERAEQRGIRLASDMVPNHMGIYSRWVIEHPDWFLQTTDPPFPAYQFSGMDLSENERVALQIEDGYWTHRDAAVVFRRVDKWTGDTKYLYHGNDGTSTPWNDTAQLNFLLVEVREAVIQLILHVARKFPIIRFDAAMTLAKKHYQRLWFPRQGDGGAIPSRAEQGMSQTEFDTVFPDEFWREVVDRVAAEVPDTLLLAEAFWLMEGYFVRTLGMHRVYNSAFMNMLKMEENSKYRLTVKNVLEFSPEVLKRFVNFMNNPDERTAVEQFGKGDKYYGVAVLMVTMPGLPMFGHGQIEGFTEKYGMEYRRAYWDEQVDQEMVRRHEAEIFPLMRWRRLFSGAENFTFYDFISPEGWVDENVFAYSNRVDGERAIILYNNAYNSTQGKIHTSTAINTGDDQEKNLIGRSLAEALALNTGDGYYYSFRDHKTGLEYLRAGRQIAVEGLFAELAAYQYHAFVDFREIIDTDGSWRELAQRLQGGGVSDLKQLHREMKLEPLLAPFRETLSGELLRGLASGEPAARLSFTQAFSRFLAAARKFSGAGANVEKILQESLRQLNSLPLEKTIGTTSLSEQTAAELNSLTTSPTESSFDHLAIAWIVLRQLQNLRSTREKLSGPALARSYLEKWLLRKILIQNFEELAENQPSATDDAGLVTILVTYPDLLRLGERVALVDRLKGMMNDAVVGEFLRVNEHDGILWLNREQLSRMIAGFVRVTIIDLHSHQNLNEKSLAPIVILARQILTAAEDAGYRINQTINLLSKSPSTAGRSDN